MRKILAISGIRSEYGNLRPVFSAICDDRDLDLELVVCGAHLSRKFGYTIDEIKKDGFGIFRKINNLSESNKLVGRLNGIGKLIPELTRAVVFAKPDFILAFGDREEPLCASIVGNYLNIPFAHISGGDIAFGNSDDMIRHAISKLAHLHFTTNLESKERLIKMGEEPWRIFNVGLPAVDVIANKQFTPGSEVAKKIGVDTSLPILVVLNNPLSSDLRQSINQTEKILLCASKFNCNVVALYPNSDPGASDIILKLEKIAKETSNVKVLPSLHQYDYFGLLSIATCLVGNSSSGILESAYFGLPVVNVGMRESARLHATNVHFTSSKMSDLKKAIYLCLFDKSRKSEARAAKRYYGNGHASFSIAKIIKTIPIDERLLIKKNTY